jgi:hypothetical protein
MRFTIALLLLLASFAAICSPTLTSGPYPTTVTQPATASVTVNGQPGPSCTMVKGADGAVTPTCDLSSLPVPGTYTLILTVSHPGGCTSPTSPSTCAAAGSASSPPFSLTRSAGAVSAPVVRIAP